MFINDNPKWELVDVYCDEGISGVSTKNRDDFNRMISDCKKGKIDKIITKSVSRFARNTLDTISTVEMLRNLNVGVIFEDENIDTSSITSANILSIHAHIAEQESLRLSKNLQQTIRRDMQRGEYMPTCIAYGYRLKDKELQICEEEAEIVRRIFREYIGGKGSYLIAKGLNEDNIPKENKCGKNKVVINQIKSALNNKKV